MNYITYWKSYVADKSICLKGHMLIETSSYFVQFDIWRRVSYFAKKFQTKNSSNIIVNPNFTWLVQCFTTLSDIQGKRSEEKNCLSKGLSQQWVSLARKSGWETAKLAPPYRWASRPSRIVLRVIFINNMVGEVVGVIVVRVLLVGVMVVEVMVISNELFGNQLLLIYQKAKVWVLSSNFKICWIVSISCSWILLSRNILVKPGSWSQRCSMDTQAPSLQVKSPSRQPVSFKNVV